MPVPDTGEPGYKCGIRFLIPTSCTLQEAEVNSGSNWVPGTHVGQLTKFLAPGSAQPLQVYRKQTGRRELPIPQKK